MKHGRNTTTAPANHNPIEDRRPSCARSTTPIHPARRNKKLTPFSEHEPRSSIQPKQNQSLPNFGSTETPRVSAVGL
jgi:hypothetical protein